MTSPTPYDPPLTYGGWTQSRALGLRIASLLQSVEDAATASAISDAHGHHDAHKQGDDSVAPHSKPRKRKHKVFIHSSPFLRCVQTSVGISAGISQYQGIVAERAHSETRPRSASSAARPSPRLHAVDISAAAIHAKSTARHHLVDSARLNKTTVRVDAYLGEWLSPDYFEHITPPPNSTMMLAGAKAELLRRGDDIKSYTHSPALASKASSGSLWNGPRLSDSLPPPPLTDGHLDMKALAQALPARDRTSSYSSGRISPFGRPAIQRARSGERQVNTGYVPPTPSYAIAPSEPIPKGYVAHARDACIDVDFHWDSMREPLEWGDGGEFGEEWSAMHKRFRKGLNHLIDWYDEHGSANLPDADEAVPAVEDEIDSSDMDEDIAVVLVTHGAGCNALIGALTEQPVLIDVGMASVTMAVRRPEKASTNGHAQSDPSTRFTIATPDSSPELTKSSRSSSRSLGLSSEYEMKLVASAEHLRPGADPARAVPSRTSSPVMAATKTVPESRRRSTMASHSGGGTPAEATWSMLDGHHRGNTSTALGSIRRLSAHNIPPQRSPSVSSATSMTGLWTPSTPPLTESSHEGTDGLTRDKSRSPVRVEPRSSPAANNNKLGISFGTESACTETSPIPIIGNDGGEVHAPTTIPTIATIAASPNRENTDLVGDLPSVSSTLPPAFSRTLSQKGLWGSAPSGIQARERGPKRRWTLQQE